MPDILLIANRTCPCPIVLDTVRERTGPDGHVLVVAPALNSRLKHYTSDTDEAAEAAAGRLDEALAYLAGAGIAERDRTRVFEPFFRGGSEAARTRNGAGLGLAISRAIVEAHGGRIWLEDAAGGTRVRFSLPTSSSFRKTLVTPS